MVLTGAEDEIVEAMAHTSMHVLCVQGALTSKGKEVPAYKALYIGSTLAPSELFDKVSLDSCLAVGLIGHKSEA